MRKFSTNPKILPLFGLSALAASILAGCNVFSLIDSPSGDEQILSAARACFDQADYDCAREYYSKLSNSYADVRASEEAFMILAENGATMASFMETFGSGGGGAALGLLAERLAPGSYSKRMAIYGAYKKADQISDVALKSLVRFVGSTALSASVLAEELATTSTFRRSELVTTPSSCNTTAACNGTPNDNAACARPASGATIGDGNTSFTLSTSGSSDANIDITAPNIAMISAGLQEMNAALSSLGASGSFGSGAGNFSEEFTNTVLNEPECFRATLIELGVGI